METAGQRPQDSISAGPPRLCPPLLMSTDGKGEENTGIRHRLCSTKGQGEEPHNRCPSESYNSLRFRTQAGGPYRQPPVAYYYQPFSTTDILNFQRQSLLGLLAKIKCKLAETHSTILGGATSHDQANGDYASNPAPYVG